MSSSRDPKSHQTTIRFSHVQWEALEAAAGQRDVSVAQYVRDAARARLEEELEEPAPQAGATAEALAERMRDAREHSLDETEGSVALRDQGRRARDRAQALRARSRENRDSVGARDASPAPPAGAAALWEQGALARERAALLHEQARKFRDEKPS
jgi:hypothetical protein